MNYGRKGCFVLDERVVNSRTCVSCGPGTLKNKDDHWGPQNGDQLAVTPQPVLGCATDKTISSIFQLQASPSVSDWGQLVKLAKLTARGERWRVECSVTGGRPWGQKQVMGGWLFPQSLGVSHPANQVFPHHVIRGVKLEFSSEARSPSADFFLFRPPEKQAVSTHL